MTSLLTRPSQTTPPSSSGNTQSPGGTTQSVMSLRRHHATYLLFLVALAAALIVLMLVAIGVGKLSVPPSQVARILWHDAMQYLGMPEALIPVQDWSNSESSAVSLIRAPRALLAVLVGGALALAGAVLQALFRNPLVSPDVIGVSAASAFGGVLAIFFGFGTTALVTGSFCAGLGAVVLVLLIGRIRTSSPILTIVLGGIVISAFFNALVSLVTYMADSDTTLPSITFWLMGSFSASTWPKVTMVFIPLLLGTAIVLLLRWRINILSLGDEDARALGINPTRTRLALISAAALLTSATVAVAGVVGWVGLVIPHLVRLIIGHDNRVVLPGSFLLGGLYVLAIDTLSRSIAEVEVPVGILTAMVGAPVFIAVLIRKARTGGALA